MKFTSNNQKPFTNKQKFSILNVLTGSRFKEFPTFYLEFSELIRKER